MIIESMLQIELNLKIICQIIFSMHKRDMWVSGSCTKNEKKSYQVFFNLLHNFVRVGVYQLKKFTKNFVNILNIIKKINLIMQLHFVLYST